MPAPAAAPAAPLARLHWQSRRGWLELDLLLQAFWRRHGESLPAAEQALLADWLALDDEHLWALLKTPPAAGKTLAGKIHPASALSNGDNSHEKDPD